MTMDQDSRFESEEKFRAYIEEAERLFRADERLASVGPHILDVKPHSRLFIFLRKIKHLLFWIFAREIYKKRYSRKIEIYEDDKIIRSANIVRVCAWNDVGKFDESLIVNEVDLDFCYRLKKSGFKLLRLNRHTLFQRGGEKWPFHIFPKKMPYYSDGRMYYNIRNAFIMLARYPEQSAYYKKLISYFFHDFIATNAHFLAHIKIWRKAKSDAKQMTIGDGQ